MGPRVAGPLAPALGLVCTLLASAGCTAPIHATPDPASSAWESDPDLARLRDVLVHIDQQYVDRPDFSVVVVGAVQALADRLPPERVTVEELATGITIQCRTLGTLEYTRKVRRNVVRADAMPAITDVYRAPCAKSSDPPEVLEHAMIVAALKRLDRHSSFLDRDQVRQLRTDAPGGAGGTTLRVEDAAESSVVVHRLPDDLGYIGVRALTDDTHKALDRALGELGPAARAGLILDLRDNPGGLLTAAVLVAEKFLDESKLVAYTEGRGPRQNMRFAARPRMPYEGFVGRWTYTTAPLAVLVNEATSAGAELIAGALQDWNRAVLFGTRTPGRTSLQTVVPLSDGSAVKLTTARWFTPRGRSLGTQGGLVPDVSLQTSASVSRASAATFAATLPRDVIVQAASSHLRGVAAPKP